MPNLTQSEFREMYNHVEIMNKEMGELRDAQKMMYVEHEKMRVAFHEAVNDLRKDFNKINTQVVENCSNIAVVRTDVNWIKESIEGFKEEIITIKQDIWKPLVVTGTIVGIISTVANLVINH